jgi:hypothetical protein
MSEPRTRAAPAGARRPAARRSTTMTALPLALLALLAGGCAGLDAASKQAGDGDIGPHTPPDGGQISLGCQPLTPSVGTKVTCTASLSGLTAKKFSWEIQDPDDQLVAVTPVGTDTGLRSKVELTVKLAGTYQIRAAAVASDNGQLSGQASLPVDDPSVPQRQYRVRIIPPPGAAQSSREISITMGGADLRGQTISLDEAAKKTVTVTWGGQPCDTQLRIFSLASDPAPTDYFLKGGSDTVRVPTAFKALLVPLQPIAPSLVKRVDSAASLGSTWTEKADVGTSLAGVVRASDGTPLQGASVSVATPTEDLLAPSTVGVTKPDGSFSVLARAGASAVLTVAPPSASALPVAVAQVTLPTPGADPWSFTFAKTSVSTFSAQLSRAGGGTPGVGALVVLSRTDQPTVGSLQIGTKSFDAKGHFRYSLSSDASGNLHDVTTGATQLSVPAGDYEVEVWPSKGEPQEQGYRVSTETLAAGVRPTPLQLQLGRRVKLTGSVAELTASAQVQITASASADRSFVGSVGDQGSFTLMVDDKTSYTVAARALGPVGKRLGAFSLTPVDVDGDHSLSAVVLPRAVIYSGSVRTSGNLVVGQAVIRVWCDDPTCPGKELVDETQSLSDGTFLVRIPARSAP